MENEIPGSTVIVYLALMYRVYGWFSRSEIDGVKSLRNYMPLSVNASGRKC